MKKLGIVIDPIQSIHYKKDSTLAMLWEASERNFEIYYFEQKDLFIFSTAFILFAFAFYINPAA